MGNCQAVDAAALVIQHPTGKIERMYWPVSASEVMKANPGHYVSLIIPLPHQEQDEEKQDPKTVHFTRVKLLRPTDSLSLGHAYRLVTSQEVMRVLRAKKKAKEKQQQQKDKVQNRSLEAKSDKGGNNQQGTRNERDRPRATPAGNASAAAAMKPKSWRPSLQSISETPS